MFTVNQTAVNGENLKKSDLDLAELNVARSSRLRSYSQFNLEDEVAEEDKATKFNAGISDNYKRLINYKKDLAENKEEFKAEVRQTAKTDARPTVKTEIRPFVKTEVRQSVITEEIAIDEEELKPTSTTMQFVEMDKDAFELKEQKNEKSNAVFKLTTKAKVMFCVYAVVVITLLTLIILNTRALKTLDTDIDNMQSQVYVMETEAEVLEQKLNIVSSEETIKQRATDILGMVESK